jgi:hypothetical protein
MNITFHSKLYSYLFVIKEKNYHQNKYLDLSLPPSILLAKPTHSIC